MTPPPPLRLLVAAGPDAPGVSQLLVEACAAALGGGRVSVFFTDAGLDVLGASTPGSEGIGGLERAGARLSLCARSARSRGLEPARLPSTVLWSSLTSFLRDLEPEARLWSAFP